jgi:hypothetical protein
MKSKRVVAYIDGFNLYFGLRDKGWRRYYWLDVRSLCQRLMLHHQTLIAVKYFTSRIKKASSDKRRRQSIYLEALGTIGITPFYGKYIWTPMECRKCGSRDEMPGEKMTDVQMAVEMVSDAYRNRFDTALLITGDIDLVPAIEKIRQEFPQKRVAVAFPPLRTSDELRRVCDGYVHVTEQVLERSQLPDQIVKPGGYVLKRPSEWA